MEESPIHAVSLRALQSLDETAKELRRRRLSAKMPRATEPSGDDAGAAGEAEEEKSAPRFSEDELAKIHEFRKSRMK